MNNKKGFTLVEVLITVAILALVSASVIGIVTKVLPKSKNDVMVIEKNEIKESANLWIEDYCNNPISDDYECKDSFTKTTTYRYKNTSTNEYEEKLGKYVCTKDLYELGIIDKITYNGVDCNGVVIYDEEGNYNSGVTYIYCEDDEISEFEDTNLAIKAFKDCDLSSSKNANKNIMITLNANGGEINELPIKKIEIQSNDDKKEEEKVYYNSFDVPTRTGYTFDGWYLTKSYETQLTESNGKIISDISNYSDENGNWVYLDSDLTIYAKWIAKTYEITFYSNGGSIPSGSNWTDSGNSATKTVTYDSKYGELPNPKFTGHTFKGWYTKSIGGTKIDEGTAVTITDNIELYAIWDAEKYTVTLNANGGTLPTNEGWINSSTNATSTKEITYDTEYGNLATPTKSGYSFEGWYLENTYINKIESNTKLKTASSHMLYAKWKSNYVLSYMYVNDNGESTIYDLRVGSNYSNGATEWNVDNNGNWNIILKKVGSYGFYFLNNSNVNFDAFVIGGGGGGGGSYHSYWCSYYCYATGAAGTGGNGGNINYVQGLNLSDYFSVNKIVSVSVGNGGYAGPGDSESYGGTGGTSQFGNYYATGGRGGSPKSAAQTSNGGSGNLSGKLGGTGAYYANSTDGGSTIRNATAASNGYYAFNNSSYNGVVYASSGGGGASAYTSGSKGGTGAGNGIGTGGSQHATTYGSGGGGGQYIGGSSSYSASSGGNGMQGAILLKSNSNSNVTYSANSDDTTAKLVFTYNNKNISLSNYQRYYADSFIKAYYWGNNNWRISFLKSSTLSFSLIPNPTIDVQLVGGGKGGQNSSFWAWYDSIWGTGWNSSSSNGYTVEGGDVNIYTKKSISLNTNYQIYIGAGSGGYKSQKNSQGLANTANGETTSAFGYSAAGGNDYNVSSGGGGTVCFDGITRGINGAKDGANALANTGNGGGYKGGDGGSGIVIIKNNN